MEEISAADDGHGPAIDRHNPIIRDPTRIAKLILSEKKKKKKKNVDEFDEAKKHGDDDDDDDGGGGGASKNDGDDEFISSIGSPVEVFSTPLVDMKRVSEYDIDIEKATPPSSPRQSYFQVIVLKVSMHCKGCERKMRKHLSKMDGISSVETDFAEKRVTITGNITPLSIVSSISNVKNVHLSIEHVTTLQSND